MRGVEVLVVSACVVGDDTVWCLYVLVVRGADELFGYTRCCLSCFDRGVVGYEDVDSPPIVGREVEVG